jgi:hypothetical protein
MPSPYHSSVKRCRKLNDGHYERLRIRGRARVRRERPHAVTLVTTKNGDCVARYTERIYCMDGPEYISSLKRAMASLLSIVTSEGVSNLGLGLGLGLARARAGSQEVDCTTRDERCLTHQIGL